MCFHNSRFMCAREHDVALKRKFALPKALSIFQWRWERQTWVMFTDTAPLFCRRSTMTEFTLKSERKAKRIGPCVRCGKGFSKNDPIHSQCTCNALRCYRNKHRIRYYHQNCWEKMFLDSPDLDPSEMSYVMVTQWTFGNESPCMTDYPSRNWQKNTAFQSLHMQSLSENN